MSRTEIVKFRCSPEELDTLQAQLAQGETLSELIRGRLGLTCSPKRTSAGVSVDNNPLPTVKDPRRLVAKGVIEPVPQQNKKKRSWGWLWLAGFILALLAIGWFIVQAQIYFMGG